MDPPNVFGLDYYSGIKALSASSSKNDSRKTESGMEQL